MPPAQPQTPPDDPTPLVREEASFIAETVKRFYGQDAVLRNFGADPSRLDIHVETDRDVGMEKYDCLGILMTRIDRPISLVETKRGTPIRGNAKIAYRQGVIF